MDRGKCNLLDLFSSRRWTTCLHRPPHDAHPVSQTYSPSEPPPPYFPPPPPTFQSSAITYNSGSSRTPTGFQSLPTVIQFRILQYYVDGIGGRRTGIGHGRNGGIREDDSPGKMERLVRLMDLRRCCRVMYLRESKTLFPFIASLIQ